MVLNGAEQYIFPLSAGGGGGGSSTVIGIIAEDGSVVVSLSNPTYQITVKKVMDDGTLQTVAAGDLSYDDANIYGYGATIDASGLITLDPDMASPSGGACPVTITLSGTDWATVLFVEVE